MKNSLRRPTPSFNLGAAWSTYVGEVNEIVKSTITISSSSAKMAGAKCGLWDATFRIYAERWRDSRQEPELETLLCICAPLKTADCPVFVKKRGVMHDRRRFAETVRRACREIFSVVGVGENFACHDAGENRIVAFKIDKLSSIWFGDETAKLQHRAAVELEFEPLAIRLVGVVSFNEAQRPENYGLSIDLSQHCQPRSGNCALSSNANDLHEMWVQ